MPNLTNICGIEKCSFLKRFQQSLWVVLTVALTGRKKKKKGLNDFQQ